MEALLVSVSPLNTGHTVNDVGDLLLQRDFRRFLCLPVVEDGRPLGTVSRDELQTIFMARFGRELHGRKSVTAVMNRKPLVVDLGQSVDEAAQYISDNLHFPITEDFIITRDGRYAGLGHVVDLLRIMQQRLGKRNQELASAYQKLKASEAQLVQSEKMASLGQMVAGVAHEINTPLGYVKNNVNLAREVMDQVRLQLNAYESLLNQLRSGEADETTVDSALADIRDLKDNFDACFSQDDVQQLFEDTLYGVNQISEIVVNLKDFSRLDKAAVDSVNLNQCLDSALLIARNVLKNKAEVIKEYSELPPVRCTPSQINQVFLNLFTNAAQAMEGYGHILVKTLAKDGFVHVIVEDNGKGIPETHLRRIFEPFFTTKPVGEGTGLGLSIAYQIVHNHGGRIRVASKVGVGTRFAVSLPISQNLQ